ncbi:hypothetical protein AQUCO_04200038v1 [Aquilegia coerulea]|uniref:squalene synthase n=1 Tax=Aquilegia coerulea TaxID=218851 RepID=A0A2G5CNZ8_AQUCA|nr:hypothetical protein AQUCO_04200038v1 [Aquilegia coerulea]
MLFPIIRHQPERKVKCDAFDLSWRKELRKRREAKKLKEKKSRKIQSDDDEVPSSKKVRKLSFWSDDHSSDDQESIVDALNNLRGVSDPLAEAMSNLQGLSVLMGEKAEVNEEDKPNDSSTKDGDPSESATEDTVSARNEDPSATTTKVTTEATETATTEVSSATLSGSKAKSIEAFSTTVESGDSEEEDDDKQDDDKKNDGKEEDDKQDDDEKDDGREDDDKKNDDKNDDGDDDKTEGVDDDNGGYSLSFSLDLLLLLSDLSFALDKMGSLKAIMNHPDELYPLLKLKIASKQAEKKIPPEPHWNFCYSMLQNVSRSFAFVIQQLDTDLRNAVAIFYLVLRALDTVEDDTSIPNEVKLPILEAFHRHIYDPDWHFSCGTKEYKILMDQLHHVVTAFLELERGYQEAIEEITKRMGAGMAKFILKEVETVDEYDEYCHYVAGLVGLGLSKLFYASKLEDLAPDSLSNSMGLFLQKTNIIRDYLEDINEIPKSRMFWPREIWSKYVNKLEDLKYEENSVKAVQCLNDMVTNALIHVEDCLKYMSALREPSIFRFCAIPQIMAIGTLALCYNNVEVFRGVVKMRRGLTAKVMDRTNTMSDVYGAFFDFSCLLKSKVEKNDPNATKTLSRIEAIQRTCRESGVLNTRRSYIVSDQPSYNSALVSYCSFCSSCNYDCISHEQVISSFGSTSKFRVTS